MSGAVRLGILCVCLLAAAGAGAFALSQPLKPIAIERSYPICLLPESTTAKQCCFSTIRLAANLSDSTSSKGFSYSPDAQFPGEGDEPIQVSVYDLRDSRVDDVQSAGLLKKCAEHAYRYWKARCPTIPHLTFKVVRSPSADVRRNVKLGTMDHCYLALVNFETLDFLGSPMPRDKAAIRTPDTSTPIGPWRLDNGWARVSGVLVNERAHCPNCSWMNVRNERLVIQHLSTTLLHELGHWWGLDHTTSSNALAARAEGFRNAWAAQIGGDCPNEPCEKGIMQERFKQGWRHNVRDDQFVVEPNATELELVASIYNRAPDAQYTNPVAAPSP